MAGEGQPKRVVPIREQRLIKCHHCQNDNLVGGFTLQKFTTVMNIGGPGQPAPPVGEIWALYFCMACHNYFPFPKSYAGQPNLQTMYKQILGWCEAQAGLKEDERKARETAKSIIESVQNLQGLPGSVDLNETIEQAVGTLADRIDDLERKVSTKKGGRPSHCKVKTCKIKAEIEGYCKSHFLEVNNE